MTGAGGKRTFRIRRFQNVVADGRKRQSNQRAHAFFVFNNQNRLGAL